MPRWYVSVDSELSKAGHKFIEDESNRRKKEGIVIKYNKIKFLDEAIRLRLKQRKRK